jgi:hypothetical protein
MATTYYLNAGSPTETQDGLTPGTGYHTLAGLLASAITLLDGDTIEFVDNGVIDDSASGLISVGTSVTLKSWSGNTNKPTWKVPSVLSYSGLIFNAFDINLTTALVASWSAIQFSGTTDIDIERCKINKWVSIPISDAARTKFENNILDQGEAWIDNSFSHNNIEYCYINNNDSYKGYLGIFTPVDVTISKVRILNNTYLNCDGTFEGDVKFDWQVLGAVTDGLSDYNIDYNCVAGDNPIPSEYVGVHNIPATNPKLTDAAGGDFTLQSDSPCINAGVDNSSESSVPTNDYIGTSRPQGAHTDIGAYEELLGTSPSILVQPDSLTKIVGQSAFFSVDATGTNPLAYQWKKDASSIADATFSSYSIASVLVSNDGSYVVNVSNAAGNIDSSAAVLTVLSPASISVQPSPLTRIVGQDATFSVTASGTSPLIYQWKKDSLVILDATFSSYIIGSVITSDAGSYKVTVDNTCSSPIDSDPAILTILVPASISVQPSPLTKIVGQSAFFSIDATGTNPLTYQWKKNNAPISDATLSSYSIASISSGDAGSYKVTIDNTCSSPIDSSTAALTVLTPASISVQPSPLTKIVGQDATFSVTASGTSPFTYLWKKDNTTIPGATSSSYIIGSVSIGSAGSYKVTVDNTCSSPIDSNSATLTILVPASISVQPVSLTKMAGQSAAFSVTASGTSPLIYQWKKDNTPISDATFSSYSIASVSSTDAGSYKVTVDNTCSLPIDSTTATLIVHTPPAITLQPVSIIRAEETSALFTMGASGDAPSFQWRKNGIDIPMATSSSYLIPNVVPTDAGSYMNHVTNAYGTADTSSATLTVVLDSPVITNQPYDTSAYSGGSARFGVTATSSVGTVYYQWHKKNHAIHGATDATYSIPVVIKSDEDTYLVTVSDAFNSIDSSSVYLTVLDSFPKEWVVPDGSETIGPGGRKYKTSIASIMDGTHNVSLGSYQVVDF